jgi:hypothetical protein
LTLIFPDANGIFASDIFCYGHEVLLLNKLNTLGAFFKLSNNIAVCIV